MNKVLTFFLISLFGLGVVSCITIYGLTNDYNKLSEEEKSMILPLKNFSNLECNKIYKLNADQLKEELKNYPKSIVYIFKNDCVSEFCMPMNVYKNFAQTHDYQLFLVMDGYAHLDATLDQMVETPYFSIDNDFYGISNRTKYIRYFENELLGRPADFKEDKFEGSLFVFEGNQYKETWQQLPKL